MDALRYAEQEVDYARSAIFRSQSPDEATQATHDFNVALERLTQIRNRRKQLANEQQAEKEQYYDGDTVEQPRLKSKIDLTKKPVNPMSASSKIHPTFGIKVDDGMVKLSIVYDKKETTRCFIYRNVGQLANEVSDLLCAAEIFDPTGSTKRSIIYRAKAILQEAGLI